MAIGMFMPMLMRRPPLEVSFLQFQKSTVDTTSYSFANVPFGEPASSRRILLAIHSNLENTRLQSVSIGGLPAMINYNPAPTHSTATAWASAIVPTGDSGTIVVTMTATSLRCAISAYRIVNEKNSEPYDMNFSSVASGSVSVNCADGGAVFFAQSSRSASSRSPSIITKRYDETVELTNFWVVGGEFIPTQDSAYTVVSAATAPATTSAISWR